MYGAGNALSWNDSVRQNSMHLTLLKYPNTKTSLYKLSKNHWVIALFKKFGSVRKKLQSTVSNDHPVALFLPPVSYLIESLKNVRRCALRCYQCDNPASTPDDRGGGFVTMEPVACCARRVSMHGSADVVFAEAFCAMTRGTFTWRQRCATTASLLPSFKNW